MKTPIMSKQLENYLYKLLSKRIEDLEELNLTTIANHFQIYQIALTRILESQPPSQSALDEFTMIQTNWCNEIKEAFRDTEALIHILQLSPKRKQRKISTDYLKKWRKTFVQKMVKQHEKLLETFSNPQTHFQPQTIQEIQMRTTYMLELFRYLDQYLKEEIHHRSIPTFNLKPQITIIRPTKQQQRKDR